MPNQLTLDNFMCFEHAELELGRHLNVFIGANGTGKTQLLKVLYATQAAVNDASSTYSLAQTGDVARFLRHKLFGVFRPGDSLGNLVRRGSDRADVFLDLGPSFGEGRWWIAQQDDLRFDLSAKLPVALRKSAPVYIPPAELLAIYPGLVSLYQARQIAIDENWIDTCVLLGLPTLRVLDPKLAESLGLLEREMDGRIELDPSGRFFLVQAGNQRTEISLVAEGLRRLGLIARLLVVGAFSDGSTLFWDEPEVSLNPRLIKEVAKTIVALGRFGVQVFIATHSLFLLRELEMLLGRETAQGLEVRYFGLHATERGVEVKQGPTPADMGDIAVLEEELAQSDRFLEEA